MNAIFLLFKLLADLIMIELKRPKYLRSNPISVKKLVMGPLVLSRFVSVTKYFISFSTTQKQQEELIFLTFQLASLIEDGFGHKGKRAVLTLDNLDRAIRLEENNSEESLIKEIIKIIQKIKAINQNNPYLNDFKNNIIKAWSTLAIRDSKFAGNREISRDEALEAANKRGGAFFLALIYLLNPINLDKEAEHLIWLSGSWFQILDDYDDREKDKNEGINTVFAALSSGVSKEVLKEYVAEYQKKIQDTNKNSTVSLIKFFYGLTRLVKLKSFVLGKKSDWH